MRSTTQRSHVSCYHVNGALALQRPSPPVEYAHGLSARFHKGILPIQLLPQSWDKKAGHFCNQEYTPTDSIPKCAFRHRIDFSCSTNAHSFLKHCLHGCLHCKIRPVFVLRWATVLKRLRILRQRWDISRHRAPINPFPQWSIRHVWCEGSLQLIHQHLNGNLYFNQILGPVTCEDWNYFDWLIDWFHTDDKKKKKLIPSPTEYPAY